MSAAKTTVLLELASRPLIISLERPAEFADFNSWRLAHVSHVISVVNSRGLVPDDCAVLAQLGDPDEFVLAALISNRRCAFVSEQQPGMSWMLRQPLSDQLAYLLMRDFGVAPLKKVTRAFVSLFSDAS
jgi:hypothetical protein